MAELHVDLILAPGVVLLTKLFLNLLVKFLFDFQELRIYLDCLSSFPMLLRVGALNLFGFGDLDSCLGLDFSGRWAKTLGCI